MKVLGVCADLRLDMMEGGSERRRHFGRKLTHGVDALLVCGDIAKTDAPQAFQDFRDGAQAPVYFVLGRMDCWDTPLESVREDMKDVPGFLDVARSGVRLSKSVVLLGTTGWYSAGVGDPQQTCLPAEYAYTFRKDLSPEEFTRLSRKVSFGEAVYLSDCLDALDKTDLRQVIVGTHFPPFIDPEVSDISSLRWSVNGCMSQVLDRFARDNPGLDIRVFSTNPRGKAYLHRCRGLNFFGCDRFAMPRISWKVDIHAR